MLVRGDRNSQSIDVSLVTPQKIPMLNASPASIAETNWKFVNQVLVLPIVVFTRKSPF
jgi:hypothetical protein